MRYYFFGDIHGNPYALERCLTHLDEVAADEVYCLGDLVGWLPFGDRTLTRMAALRFPTVAGNHDLLVAGLFTDHPEQLDRMQASAYNAGLLSTIPDAGAYLSSLPLFLEQQDFVVVHHSPFHLPAPGDQPSIACFGYLDETALGGCLESWRAYPKRLIFSGHDHLPAIYELAADVSQHVTIYHPPPEAPLTVQLRPELRYWIKVGSVGGPYRDEVPVVNSVLYDSRAQTITLHRLTYDTRALHRELVGQRFFCNLKTLQRYMELLANVG